MARVGIPAGGRAGVCEFEDMQKGSVFTEEEAGGESPQVPLKEYTKLIQSRPCLPASGGRRIEDASRRHTAAPLLLGWPRCAIFSLVFECISESKVGARLVPYWI